MRNVFSQYQQPENRLTHALVCALAEDSYLLKRFTRWTTGRAAPRGKIQIIEQQCPGEEARREDEATGIPDAWIFNDDGWALLIESKITAHLSAPQLRRHLATAARRGFPNATLLAVTVREEAPSIKGDVIALPWVKVYGWLSRERRRSKWAARCASYMEILESDLIEQGKLREGGVTAFSGIPFDLENPYSYLEAKRLLKLAMDELRREPKLKRELRMDPTAPGRGAITGSEGPAVWDFLRLRHAKGAQSFTQYPHLTLAIERDRLLAIVTIPNSIRADLRRRLLDLGLDGFSALLSEVNERLAKALRGDKGAAPRVVVVQRRYMTQSSPAIHDASLDFDLRTVFQTSRRRGKRIVKPQPQWLSATFNALSKKRSNLQIAIGASFPYAQSSTVREREIIDRIAATWIACKPLLTTMGLK
jgi:hypothetical protein